LTTSFFAIFELFFHFLRKSFTLKHLQRIKIVTFAPQEGVLLQPKPQVSSNVTANNLTSHRMYPLPPHPPSIVS